MTLGKSFFAGLLFLGFGICTIALATEYPFGTPLSIGPGFLPTLAGGLLAAMGVAMMVKGALAGGPVLDLGEWHLKPLLIICIAVVGFGLLIEPAGLLVSSFFLVLVCWMAGEKPNLLEGLIYAALYSFVIVLLFVYGLRIQFKVWPL